MLLASSSTTNNAKVALNTGSESVVATDYQGNETVLRAPGGSLALDLSPMKVFIEGGNLDVLKSYCAVAVGDGNRFAEFPAMTLVKGSTAKIPIAVKGVYDQALDGAVSITTPAGWPPSEPRSFSVQPGRMERLPIPLVLPATVASGTYPIRAVFTFQNAAIPAVAKSLSIAVITREMVGNLLKNGGFEEAGADETIPAGWVSGGKSSTRQPSGGGLGLGSSVLKFETCAQWEYISQEIMPPPGQTYLYSAWVWNNEMKACSNIEQMKTDGTKSVAYSPTVFMSGKASRSWCFYACRSETPPNLKSIAFVPTVQGSGWALYDNLRVTIFEGSNYAAEARKTKAPVRLDGNLDGWDKSCPIPLLCENQISVVNKSYQWTPENLSGVAYLMWDDKALYLAVEVMDDVHCAQTTGEQTLDGDSVALAIHPANRAPGKDDKAFVYYLSSASPGGGSGTTTLYRPPSHGGGLSSGQLAKDSSAYDLFIKTEGKKTVYQLRMPWSELGGIAPAFGSKFGLSLLLNDNDGAGKTATMSWGDGLIPSWVPSSFGICTLVE